MKVLLVGTDEYFHVGSFFRKALELLGHEFRFVNEGPYLDELNRSLFNKSVYRLFGRALTQNALNRKLVNSARDFEPDVVLVTKGVLVAPSSLVEIKRVHNAILVNFATDDPFNTRVSSKNLLATIPLYDLYCSTKRAIIDDVRRAGCRKVIYIPFGYEPTLHFPESPIHNEEKERFSSDVLFIGGGDRDRFPILREVATIPGIRLHLYGGYWERDSMLKPFCRGMALGRDYRLALNGTKIAICLVRRANRDGHVMRSFETPACGAFMLAERTAEHAEFFTEGYQMACFGSTEELLDKIRYYLVNGPERQRIATSGYYEVTTAGHTYTDRLQHILTFVKDLM